VDVSGWVGRWMWLGACVYGGVCVCRCVCARVVEDVGVDECVGGCRWVYVYG